MVEFNGKKYGFMLTTGAYLKIRNMCPEKDTKRIAEALFTDDEEKALSAQMQFAAYLNEGYAEFSAIMGRKADTFDVSKMSAIPMQLYIKIKDAAIEAYTQGQNGEIDAEIVVDESKNAQTEAEA